MVETGAGVKNLKAGDKVVAMLSIFVSVVFFIAFPIESQLNIFNMYVQQSSILDYYRPYLIHLSIVFGY